DLNTPKIRRQPRANKCSHSCLPPSTSFCRTTHRSRAPDPYLFVSVSWTRTTGFPNSVTNSTVRLRCSLSPDSSRQNPSTLICRNTTILSKLCRLHPCKTVRYPLSLHPLVKPTTTLATNGSSR